MRWLLLAMALAAAAPLAAQDVFGLEADIEEQPEEIPTLVVTGLRPADMRVPAQLSAAQRAAYSRIFADIAAGRLAAAQAALDQMPRGVLHPAAQAQIFLKRGAAAGRANLVRF
ncbi:MAG: hypothetical protein SNJ63_08690, partial [Sphingomonadaceae bacterium]